MNCFEARQGFVPFWQRTMPWEQRAAFAAHLQVCQRCDRSFRVFALTAPVLHSKSEPMVVAARPRTGKRASVRTMSLQAVKKSTGVRSSGSPRSLWTLGAAGAMAAALFAAYISAARPSSAYALEQTITGDDSGVELTSFSTGGELFGVETSTQEPSARSLTSEAPQSIPDDFAG
jgi:hypothetical protein